MELAVDAGERSDLMGRNGMGKTTTVNAIMGLCNEGGSWSFEGARVDHLNSFRIASLGLGLVPEGRNLPNSVCARTVGVGRERTSSGNPGPSTRLRLLSADSPSASRNWATSSPAASRR